MNELFSDRKKKKGKSMSVYGNVKTVFLLSTYILIQSSLINIATLLRVVSNTSVVSVYLSASLMPWLITIYLFFYMHKSSQINYISGFSLFRNPNTFLPIYGDHFDLTEPLYRIWFLIVRLYYEHRGMKIDAHSFWIWMGRVH